MFTWRFSAIVMRIVVQAPLAAGIRATPRCIVVL